MIEQSRHLFAFSPHRPNFALPPALPFTLSWRTCSAEIGAGAIYLRRYAPERALQKQYALMRSRAQRPRGVYAAGPLCLICRGRHKFECRAVLQTFSSNYFFISNSYKLARQLLILRKSRFFAGKLE